jgi:hypothetical protein
MSNASLRPICRILGFALVCGAALSLAPAARAGVDVVNSPFGDAACLAPSDVTDALADPNGYYAAAPKCESLCKRAGKDCAQYVKLSASCQKAEIDDDASYAKQECEVEFEHGMESTVCKTEVEHGKGDDHGSARSDRDEALGVCDEWEHACEASCPTSH